MVFLDDHHILFVSAFGLAAYKLPLEPECSSTPISLQPYWREKLPNIAPGRLRPIDLSSPRLAVTSFNPEHGYWRCAAFGGLHVWIVDVPRSPLLVLEPALNTVHTIEGRVTGTCSWNLNATSTVGVYVRKPQPPEKESYHTMATVRLGRNLHRARTRLGEHAGEVLSTGFATDQLQLKHNCRLNRDTTYDEETGHMLVVNTSWNAKDDHTQLDLLSTL
jgi:hypothetical protein